MKWIMLGLSAYVFVSALMFVRPGWVIYAAPIAIAWIGTCFMKAVTT